MIFRQTRLPGAHLIELDEHRDDRGFFARAWCKNEFELKGLDSRLVQCNISFNKRKGTLRGMHYQDSPFQEAKLVRCTRGSIWDVIIDLRSGSPTFKQHISQKLTADNHLAIYVPEGFAHGFQTLEDDSEVFYQMSEFYSPQYQRGVRFNDPAFGINWPIKDPIMTDRDRTYPDVK